MGTPFFSIVIPTRNRPRLFQETLRSALLQDFDDFEVIVSNNSNDEETSAIIEKFQDNSRLSIFQPGENLSMPEHWEFATKKAHGRYVLILTDRSVLKQHALRTIHDAVCSSKQDIQICSWRWSLFDDSLNLEFADSPITSAGKVLNLPSQKIIQDFAAGNTGFPYQLPRGMNSCYRNDLADEIRGKHGALFLPISPDFTSAFLLLAHADNVLFLDSAIFISQGLSVSTGGNTSRATSTLNAYLTSVGSFDYYAHTPMKKPLVESLIYEDFLAISEKALGNLQGITLDWTNYFAACYRELIEIKAAGLGSKKEYISLMMEWERALSTFDKATQNKVKKKIARTLSTRVKVFLKYSSLGPFTIRMKRRFETRLQAKGTILSQAGFNIESKD